MKYRNRFIAAIGGFILLISSGLLLGQDWPQWRGQNRDGRVIGFVSPGQWPKTLTQKWKATVGFGDATPALVGDRLYVFTRQDNDEVTRCLDAGSGKELWRSAYEAQAVSGPAARHPGPRSSPTVAKGKVVTLGVGGILTCLDAATGKVVWSDDAFSGIVPAYFTGMSPIIVDEICVAHLGGKDNSAVIAFDLMTGSQVWKWIGDGPAYASPVLMTAGGTKHVVVQSEKNITGLSLTDGTLLWQIPTPPERRFYNSATPIVEGQTMIYTGQGNGTRAVKIDRRGDAFNIEKLWDNEGLGTGFNTPVLKDALLFGISDRGNIFCMHAENGHVAWTDTSRTDRFGAVLDAGSVILALPASSDLIVFKPSDKQYEELARIEVSDSPIYAHPVIAGNRIFIKDQETVTMFMID